MIGREGSREGRAQSDNWSLFLLLVQLIIIHWEWSELTPIQESVLVMCRTTLRHAWWKCPKSSSRLSDSTRCRLHSGTDRCSRSRPTGRRQCATPQRGTLWTRKTSGRLLYIHCGHYIGLKSIYWVDFSVLSTPSLQPISYVGLSCSWAVFTQFHSCHVIHVIPQTVIPIYFLWLKLSSGRSITKDGRHLF